MLGKTVPFNSCILDRVRKQNAVSNHSIYKHQFSYLYYNTIQFLCLVIDNKSTTTTGLIIITT